MAAVSGRGSALKHYCIAFAVLVVVLLGIVHLRLSSELGFRRPLAETR